MSSERSLYEVEKFYSFYVDLIENHNGYVKYYLDDMAILKWFGRTIKGSTNIEIFLKSNVSSCTHYLDSVCLKDYDNFSEILDNAFHLDKKTEASTSSAILLQEMGQGDGFHNIVNNNKLPVKKIKLGDGQDQTLGLKYMFGEGTIEYGKISNKKLLHETKWKKPCKLHVSFSGEPENYVIDYIIYEGNLKCRKNLMDEFSAEECEM